MPGGESTFLVGGEPDVWVPVPTDASDWPAVMVDGQPHELTEGRLGLRSLRMAEGRHEVTVGATRLLFTTIDTVGVNLPAGAAALGNPARFDRRPAGRPARAPRRAPRQP